MVEHEDSFNSSSNGSSDEPTTGETVSLIPAAETLRELYEGQHCQQREYGRNNGGTMTDHYFHLEDDLTTVVETTTTTGRHDDDDDDTTTTTPEGQSEEIHGGGCYGQFDDAIIDDHDDDEALAILTASTLTISCGGGGGCDGTSIATRDSRFDDATEDISNGFLLQLDAEDPTPITTTTTRTRLGNQHHGIGDTATTTTTTTTTSTSRCCPSSSSSSTSSSSCCCWSDEEIEIILMGTSSMRMMITGTPKNVLDFRRQWPNPPIPDTRQVNRVLYKLYHNKKIQKCPPKQQKRSGGKKNHKPCWTRL